MVQVTPALKVKSLGTSSIEIRTGILWANLTQVNDGFTFAKSLLPKSLSLSVIPFAILSTCPFIIKSVPSGWIIALSPSFIRGILCSSKYP